MKRVGIIGGLGPATTSKFYLDIISLSYEKDKTKRPPIVISSVPLPYEMEKDALLNNVGLDNFVPYLLEEAHRLEASGVDFIVMPCNSLHIHIENIRSAVTIPVLSIIEETVKFLRKEDLSRVGVLSTLVTMQNRLYEDTLNKNDIETILPNAAQQKEMNEFIHKLVMGENNVNDRSKLENIITTLEKQNINAVILACTDLQLLSPKHRNVKIFDTMEVLADATVKKILE